MGIKTCNFELPIQSYTSKLNGINFDARDFWADAHRRLTKQANYLNKMGIRVTPEFTFMVSADKVTGTYKILEGKPRVFLFMGACFDIDTGYMLLTNKVCEDPIVMFSLKEVLTQYDVDISWEKFVANVEKFKLNVTDMSFNPFEDIRGSMSGSVLKQILVANKPKSGLDKGQQTLVDICTIVSYLQTSFTEIWEVRDYINSTDGLSDESIDFVNKMTTAKNNPYFRYNLSELRQFTYAPTEVKNEYLMERLVKASSLTPDSDAKSMKILEGVFEVMRAANEEEADNFLYNAMVSPEALKQAAKNNEISKTILKGSVLSGLVKKYADSVRNILFKDAETMVPNFYLSRNREESAAYDDIKFKKYTAFMDRALKVFKPYL